MSVLFILTGMAIVLNKLNKKRVNVPFKNCKFYSKNNFLKCAVNPSDVMTEKAVECHEHFPQDQKLSLPFWQQPEK
jgi:hypothetical protein